MDDSTATTASGRSVVEGDRRAGRLHGALRRRPPDARRSWARSWATSASRGKGVGREAERLTNKKAYEEFGAHKVYGRIPATNEAAKKAVIYNGWKQEGVLRSHVRHGDELIDVELWGGFPEDQPPSRPRTEPVRAAAATADRGRGRGRGRRRPVLPLARVPRAPRA